MVDGWGMHSLRLRRYRRPTPPMFLSCTVQASGVQLACAVGADVVGMVVGMRVHRGVTNSGLASANTTDGVAGGFE